MEQLSERLKYEQGLSTQLAGELSELRNKENAARGILQKIAELAQGQHPEPGDERRARRALRTSARPGLLPQEAIDVEKRPPENRRKTGGSKLRNGCDPSIGKATQFRPGVCPNPGGRPKARPISDALREVMFEDPDSLKQIAQQALKRAQTSVKWFAEVRDTVDGKPVIAIANPEGETFQVDAHSAVDKLMRKLCPEIIRQDPENV